MNENIEAVIAMRAIKNIEQKKNETKLIYMEIVV